jgi:predicted tellurium resistance membrane protein TerC
MRWGEADTADTLSAMDSVTKETAVAATGKPILMRIGIGLFAIGMLAVLAVFVMFAAGLENLPVWLSAVAGVVTPLGLLLGLIALVREARAGKHG